MTAFGSSPGLVSPTFVDGVPAIEDLPATERSRGVMFPGRWVGGALGAAASLIVGAVLAILGTSPGGQLLLGAAAVCALGVPIAFVLGRHLEPIAVEPGTASAVRAVLTFGLLAPLLGDVEIVAGSILLAPMGSPDGWTSAIAVGLLVVTVGAAVCFIAVPVTVAVGVVWILLLRAVPEARIRELRAPAWLDRLGVRHAILAVTVVLLVARVLGLVGAPPTEEW